MKSLLTVTALLEGATGLGLVTIPSMLVSILLGTSLTDPTALLICRLTGAALITVALACWISSREGNPTKMVMVMLGYNAFCIGLLVYAALVEKMKGQGLWPVVVIHAGLFIWSFIKLKRKK